MIFKTILLFILFLSSLEASFEKVRIGKIDDYYQEKITTTQLENIVKEIEQIFETQLGFDVFDLSNDGKPIDILYLPPSTLEKRVNRKIATFDKKAKKLEKLRDYFPIKKAEIESLKSQYDLKSKYLNKKILELNTFIKEANNKRYTKKKFEDIKNYITLKKDNIEKEKKEKNALERELKRVILRFNNKILQFNNTIREARFLSKEIESLNRNNKIVKGRTFGHQKITMKTYFKNGKKYKEKNVKNSMNKIEIYNFESINQLKVVLAHEIAHLVGIPHINISASLMHPLLQKEQLKQLHLTKEDIINFKNNF